MSDARYSMDRNTAWIRSWKVISKPNYPASAVGPRGVALFGSLVPRSA